MSSWLTGPTSNQKLRFERLVQSECNTTQVGGSLREDMTEVTAMFCYSVCIPPLHYLPFAWFCMWGKMSVQPRCGPAAFSPLDHLFLTTMSATATHEANKRPLVSLKSVINRTIYPVCRLINCTDLSSCGQMLWHHGSPWPKYTLTFFPDTKWRDEPKCVRFKMCRKTD